MQVDTKLVFAKGWAIQLFDVIDKIYLFDYKQRIIFHSSELTIR